jgi:AMMECR1 domain-containing protein
LNHEEACGATPLNGLLSVAKKKALSLKLLSACNSGDTAGGHDRVVGYSSFGLFEGAEPSLDEAGKTLLAIARNAIEKDLFNEKRTEERLHPGSIECGATFVTLTQRRPAARLHRQPRGRATAGRRRRRECARRRASAIRASRASTAEEWPRCESRCRCSPRRSGSSSPTRRILLAQLEPGVDGVILECDNRRSTFLPQVWESLPDKRAFPRRAGEEGRPAGRHEARALQDLALSSGEIP